MLDNNRLDGKVALVTGAGGEIGAATVKLMIVRGARIVAVDRDKEALQKLAAGLGHGLDLTAVEGDVIDEGSVAAFVARAREATGRIDIFFNNAGSEGAVYPIAEYPLADFRRALDVNVVGVFLGLKYVIPVMAGRRRRGDQHLQRRGPHRDSWYLRLQREQARGYRTDPKRRCPSGVAVESA
jgi:NAD(P)-dependent dehydrogenase (short-subunit alcohol dehydrogenase family)